MILSETARITPEMVREVLSRHILTDGMDMVLDMRNSSGAHLIDQVTGRSYIDFFTFFASNPLGMNHPGLVDNQDFVDRLMDSALNKISNSDVYTEHYARFVDTFERVGIPDYLPHAFFVSGGALAVENALKIAFDWKVRKNFKKGYTEEKGHQVLHFEQAFHGRSGYTMSLTNTDPWKVKHFPKFDWPRVMNPKANDLSTPEKIQAVAEAEDKAIAQAKQYFVDRKDDIAAIILEPIQGEGGDNHFRPEFFTRLRQLADENEALLIFDEVQTGVGLTGHFWAHQALGVKPDVIAFGKKTQVCGVLAGTRIDEVDDNVFEKSSRINSTWGGNLVDMVRFDRILEVIEEHSLVDNAAAMGDHLQRRLHSMAEKHDAVTAVRGLGLLSAFDLPDADTRNDFVKRLFDAGVIILGCGERSIRFRPALTIGREDLDAGLDLVEEVLAGIG